MPSRPRFLLVASMVLLVVSHYESHIADQFIERAARSGDPHVANFVKKHVSRRFRSPDIGKINAALGEFGAEYRERFASRVENTEARRVFVGRGSRGRRGSGQIQRRTCAAYWSYSEPSMRRRPASSWGMVYQARAAKAGTTASRTAAALPMQPRPAMNSRNAR